MTKTVALILAIVLTAATNLCAQPREWRQEVVFETRFGTASDRYGKDLLERNPESVPRVVSCFTVTQDNILVFDWFKRDIKIYDPQGRYLRTIIARVKSGQITERVRARDIAVVGDAIYLLIAYPAKPSSAASRFQVYSFDLERGGMGEHLPVENPDLATLNIAAARVRPEDAVLVLPGSDELSIFDYYTQLVFPFVRRGQVVSRDEQNSGHAGRPFGQARLREGRDTGSVEIVGSGDVTTVVSKDATVVAVSNDGTFFAVDYLAGITIYNEDGDAVGQAGLYSGSNSRFETLRILKRHRIINRASGPELYRVFVDVEDVKLIRWSP